MSTASASATETVLVACLCAGWCRLCDDYAAVFHGVVGRLATERPGLEAQWVDIEDEADLCDDLDIETFPTLLVCSAAGVHFAGVLQPHAATLERVVRASLDVPAVPADLPQRATFQALADRL
ncbi:MAG TPA: thioredoxin domain-containing protein, partial [Actinomycetales bacterium]